MPIARVLHASLIRDPPGSAIWNSASTAMTTCLRARRHALLVRLDLVDETPLVSQRDQGPRRLLQALGRARRQRGADLAHQVDNLCARSGAEARHLRVVSVEARLA